jgi:hypothetical protein
MRSTPSRATQHRTATRVLVFLAFVAAYRASPAQTRASAPDSQTKRPRIEFFGQLVTDGIYDFNVVDPEFYDVLRPTQLPAFEGEFGPDNHSYFSVRPTRFGVRTAIATKAGDVEGIFDWELFGTGPNSGRTMFSLARAYAELGNFGAGQFDTPFMDIDVFPNSLEFWGPTGIVFFHNVQFRYMPAQGDSRVTSPVFRYRTSPRAAGLGAIGATSSSAASCAGSSSTTSLAATHATSALVSLRGD